MTACKEPNQSGARICAGCACEIRDQFILRVAPNLEWHASCLKCCECRKSLDENCTCFVRDGKIFCRDDYLRMYSAKCAKCKQYFGKTDYVMRAKNKIFHLSCFRCTDCNREFMPGEQFAMSSHQIYCQEDHAKRKMSLGVPEENNNTYNRSDSSRDKEIKKRLNLYDADIDQTGIDDEEDIAKYHNHPLHVLAKESKIEHDKDPGGEDEDEDDDVLGECGGERRAKANEEEEEEEEEEGSLEQPESTPCRPRHHQRRNRAGRVRTVLSEKQLNVLKSCYSANPRPDALVKEQLVELTGLSPRVVRVWFQNKRCKDKKKMALREGKNGKKMAYSIMSGVPLVATPPIRPSQFIHSEHNVGHSGMLSPFGPTQLASPQPKPPNLPIDDYGPPGPFVGPRHPQPRSPHLRGYGPHPIESFEPPWKSLTDFVAANQDDFSQDHRFHNLAAQMKGFVNGEHDGSSEASPPAGHLFGTDLPFLESSKDRIGGEMSYSGTGETSYATRNSAYDFDLSSSNSPQHRDGKELNSISTLHNSPGDTSASSSYTLTTLGAGGGASMTHGVMGT